MISSFRSGPKVGVNYSITAMKRHSMI
jgi:hypothetical protein